jgi:tetratricopeptide (TPR) repeat protein
MVKACLPKITLLIFIFSSSLYAQQRKIDSLKNLISKTKTDTGKVVLYWMLGHAYYEGKKMDSAVSSFQNSITINEKNNYSTLLLGWATAALDYLLYEMGNYLESLNYAVQHLALSEKLNDTTGKGAAHLVFGHDYKYLGYYREALDHYFQARKFFKMDWEAKTGKEDNIYTFLCIAETYLKMKQLDSSFQFTQLAYKQAVEKADGGGILFATRLFGDI